MLDRHPRDSDMLKKWLDKRKKNSTPETETKPPETNKEAPENVSAQISNYTLRESTNDTIDLSSVMDDLTGAATSEDPTLSLQTIIRTLIQNTNAEKAMYLQKTNDVWTVTLCGEYKNDSISFAQDQQQLIPKNIINYVTRAKEPLISANAMQDENIVLDDYLTTYQPASVLCYPIVDQDQISSVFYLENSSMTGAFTQDHLKIIKMLIPLQTMWVKSRNAL